MKSRHAAAILPFLLGVLAARPAPAADRPCARIAVETEASLLAHWPDLPGQVRTAFEARVDVDACARVQLTGNRASIAVAVVLPDGRSASRWVSRPEDVVPMLEALLLVPEPRRLAPAPGTETATATAPLAASATRTHDIAAKINPAPSADRDPPPGSPAVQASGVGVELSIATTARIGDGQAGAGLAALSMLDVAGWLAGFEGRVDAYQGTSAGAPTGALELAVLGGRRLRSGTLALDLVAGPAVALRGTTKSVQQVGTTGPVVTTSTSRVEPRLILGARLNLRARSTLRTFVGVEGELGRSTDGADLSSDLPPLPAWTVGLAFGVAVGTR
ncbi:MAG TPA: hypothetical protein VFH68_16780 [Polyangia bacterium]|nr:hypothetical protein [Polyangia bacterium]